MKFSFSQRLILAFVRRLDRRKPWHQRGKILGGLSIYAIRVRLRTWNLWNTDLLPTVVPQPPAEVKPDERQRRARTSDGSFNDLQHPDMGMGGARLGRNMPFQRSIPPVDLLEPNPREVSEQLLARDGEFHPVPFLNLLAAAWLQFMVHDWFSHDNQSADPIEVPVKPGGGWGEPSMLVRRTKPDPIRLDDGGPPAYRNFVTHWWDASQVYGSSSEIENELRLGVDGKLRLDENGLLPLQDKPQGKVDRTGANDNWWIGLSIMHTLFAREHNQICEMLKRTEQAKRQGWDDDRLFDQARLVNSALLAKIHTVDWTPAILPHPTMVFVLNSNWWGIFGKRGSHFFRRFTRSDILAGIPGSRHEHHTAPYAITEDFVAVYRMHGLLPDRITFRRLGDNQELGSYGLLDVSEQFVRPVVEQIGFHNAVYSFGHEHPGLVTLGNFPDSLRNFVRPNGNHIDLAAIDLLRDRERGIPCYNDFREFLGRTRVKSFEELLGGPPAPGDEATRLRYEKYLPRLKALYKNDIDSVDLQIGLQAEPLVKGLGFSETALYLFTLMASRRLKSDRFLTDDYRPEIYTAEGIRWIEESSMVDVLRRNVPELAPVLKNVSNAFNPWGQ